MVNRISLNGASKNSDFFVSASGSAFRKYRAENLSVRLVRKDRPGRLNNTELTPQSRKKCSFRNALKFKQRNLL
jgi:hypothetical protein